MGIRYQSAHLSNPHLGSSSTGHTSATWLPMLTSRITIQKLFESADSDGFQSLPWTASDWWYIFRVHLSAQWFVTWGISDNFNRFFAWVEATPPCAVKSGDRSGFLLKICSFLPCLHCQIGPLGMYFSRGIKENGPNTKCVAIPYKCRLMVCVQSLYSTEKELLWVFHCTCGFYVTSEHMNANVPATYVKSQTSNNIPTCQPRETWIEIICCLINSDDLDQMKTF